MFHLLKLVRPVFLLLVSIEIEKHINSLLFCWEKNLETYILRWSITDKKIESEIKLNSRYLKKSNQ
jgi:hypothetical protein